MFCENCNRPLPPNQVICLYCNDPLESEQPQETQQEQKLEQTCPFCSETIKANAVKCKHCGEFLDAKLRDERTPQKFNPGTAALLSLVIPGAGQMYKGQVFNGLAWLFVVVAGYVFFVVPGVLLHICCIIGASMGSRK